MFITNNHEKKCCYLGSKVKQCGEKVGSWSEKVTSMFQKLVLGVKNNFQKLVLEVKSLVLLFKS